MLGYLWPDTDEDGARRNLTQAVYALRRDLGDEDAILGTTTLRLNPDVLTSDVGDFDRALAEDRPADAVALFAAPFLDGFHLSGAGEFERWVEAERADLGHRYADALESLATRAEADGDHCAAAAWWRRLAAHDRLNARVALGVMRSLARAGDAAGALRHAEIYGILVRQELGIEPDRDVNELAGRNREGAHRPPGPAVPAPSVSDAPSPPPPPAAPAPAPAVRPSRATRPSRARRLVAGMLVGHRESSPVLVVAVPSPRWLVVTVALIAAVLLAAVAAAAVVLRRLGGRADTAGEPVLAVGQIADRRGGADTGLGGGRPTCSILRCGTRSTGRRVTCPAARSGPCGIPLAPDAAGGR